jgi:hypothetical protein
MGPRAARRTAFVLALLATRCGGRPADLVPPSDLTYSSNPAVYVAGTTITPNTPRSAGGPVASYHSPALPAGLTLDTGTGVVTGIPIEVLAAAVYTVTASNAAGSATASLSISVIPADYLCASVTCPSAVDRCHVAGTCSPANGVCSVQTALSCPANHTCDTSDGQCKPVDLCAFVTCPPAADRCHVAGVCSPSTGTCSAPSVVQCPPAQVCDLADGTCKVPYYSISGTVSGALPFGVTVTLGGASSATTVTDGSGHYTFSAVTNGDYTVTPSLRGYTFSPASTSVRVNGANVTGQDFSDSANPWSSVASGTTSSFNGVWGSGPHDVWVVGDGPTMHGNGSALTIVNNTSNALFGVWGSGVRDVWAVGNSGTIMHWDGSTWFAVAGGTTDFLRAVWGSGPADVWAVGGSGARGSIIRHWDGTAWSTVASSGILRLASIWGSGPRDVWAAGALGTIVHWDGSVWASVATGTTTTVGIAGVWGSGPNDVWMVGAAGTILNWNGTAWSVVPSGTTYDLNGVWGTGPRDVWAVGEAVGAGIVLHWNGMEWSSVSSLADRPYCVWGSGVSDVWAVGMNGNIWHGP